MKIKLHPKYKTCEESDCKFRLECAQHSTAGDYRGGEDGSGFTPELQKDTKRKMIFCLTTEESRSRVCGFEEFPQNFRHLGNGSVDIENIPEALTKKIPVSDSEIDDEFSVLASSVLASGDSAVIDNGNYEQLQELIIDLGGCFIRKDKIEKMTIKEFVDMMTLNLKRDTKITFAINKK